MVLMSASFKAKKLSENPTLRAAVHAGLQDPAYRSPKGLADLAAALHTKYDLSVRIANHLIQRANTG